MSAGFVIRAKAAAWVRTSLLKVVKIIVPVVDSKSIILTERL